MELIGPDRAESALRELLADESLPAFEVDPAAYRGPAGATVLAVATAADAVVFDLSNPHAFSNVFRDLEAPVAAIDGKAIYRALALRGVAPPKRWACATLVETLIACGRPVDGDANHWSRLRCGDSLPDADEGLAALGERARGARGLVVAQIPALKDLGLVWVSRIEAAALAPVAEMELRGFPFDAERWRRLGEEGGLEQASLARELGTRFADAGHGDLFGGDGMMANDVSLRGALRALGFTVPNLRRSTLAALPEPWGPLLARHRELGKLLSAYGESFLRHAREGRLFPTFEQIGASTGRMACHSPNLQSVVKDSPYRECFAALPGRALVTADYEGCELRIIAELSGDPVFVEAFERGEDLHARVASTVFGRPVTKHSEPELRQRAKSVNFGLAYGMGAAGLAKAIGSDRRQAEELLERYFRAFPRIRGFFEHSAQRGVERGFVQTLTGRRLNLGSPRSSDERARAERVAKNMPIQGTNADIIKIALARVWRALGQFSDAWIVNSVHDEIVVECDESESRAVAEVVRDEMVRAGAEVLRRIPLEVHAVVGRGWAK